VSTNNCLRMHSLKVIYTIFNTTLTLGLFAFREVGAVVILFVIVAPPG